jgi:hypothetical protein
MRPNSYWNQHHNQLDPIKSGWLVDAEGPKNSDVGCAGTLALLLAEEDNDVVARLTSVLSTRKAVTLTAESDL